MPCIAPIADAIGKLTGGDADELILEACFETFRKTFERVSESLTAGLRTKRTIGIRSVWIGTVGGFAKARYPYAPGEVTGRDAVKCFGGEEQSGTVRTKDGKGGAGPAQGDAGGPAPRGGNGGPERLVRGSGRNA